MGPRRRPRGRRRLVGPIMVALLVVVGVAAAFVPPPVRTCSSGRRLSVSGPQVLAAAARRAPPPAPHVLASAAWRAPSPPSPSSSGAAPQLTPAQRVQYALEPEDILAAVTAEMVVLKPTHLAAALLRIGKMLVQPRSAARRQQLVGSAEYQAVVRAALEAIAAPGGKHVRCTHDALLGMALVEFPLREHPDARATVERLFTDAGLLGDAAFGALTPGEVSGLAWCWGKLGLDQGDLPVLFKERLQGFPFRVRIGALKGDDLLDLPAIIEEVALRRDSITIGSKSIEESRLTAWQGPNPFYYSNKEMAPSPMTPRIATIRDRLAAVSGVFYDCVLINLYEDGKTGMRYHIDPDQGLYWTTNTAVVSIGDTREFCLRDIETKGKREHHRFFVSQADAVEMVDDCQERYQHCVKVCEAAEDAGPRISLVYKQSLGLSAPETK